MVVVYIYTLHFKQKIAGKCHTTGSSVVLSNKKECKPHLNRCDFNCFAFYKHTAKLTLTAMLGTRPDVLMSSSSCALDSVLMCLFITKKVQTET